MGRYSTAGIDGVQKARMEFLARGVVPAGLVADNILRSWQRSADLGVAMERRDVSCAPRYELMRRRNKNHALLTRSIPIMDNLFHEISGTSSMVLLADNEGVILHSVGDPDFVEQARKVSLKPGGIWSEGMNGTNAIGTALEDQAPVLVHSTEHFMEVNRFLTCAAAPIFDPMGRTLGVLDVSGDSRTHQNHTMALVRLSAQMIENQMFLPEYPNEIIINFHLRPEFLGTHYEGIAVFSTDGRFLAANRSALLQLSLDRSRMASMEFSSIFAMSLGNLLEQARMVPQPVIKLPLQSGLELYGRVWPGGAVSSITFLPVSRGAVASNCTAAPERKEDIRLSDLELGDQKMKTLIDKAMRVLGHDIPILIEGESGTGKEQLARALHNAGRRGKGPFVPVNCASIPEGLIESELFGYQEGAFTGARRKGHMGKIREADGGTLFLDEIGEMPLHLQARLLRVLQDRNVSPLGSSASHKVDISVVCATNRRVRDAVASGSFREDLYYRLNGLLITLPSLRDRADRIALANGILGRLVGEGCRIGLSDEVVDIFESHPWPGNIRQMHNVLRTALALIGTSGLITAGDLPEDFIDQAADRGSLPEVVGAPAVTDGEPLLTGMESRLIASTVERTGGNIAAAARILGISRNTLYRKLREQGA